MKKVMVLLFSVGLILGSGQAFAIHEIIPSETVTPLPGADAIKLNEYVVKYDPCRAWQLWSDRGTLYRGNEPHGALLTPFVNKEAYYAIKNKTAMGEVPQALPPASRSPQPPRERWRRTAPQQPPAHRAQRHA